MNEMDREGQGDIGVQSVKRGLDGEYLSNAEYAIVLPDVDKVSVGALAVIELAAILTNSPVWSAELHFAAVIAIAGLGGYSLVTEEDDVRRPPYSPPHTPPTGERD